MRATLLSIGLSFLFVGCVNAPDDIGAATYAVCCGSGCCCPSIGTGGRINAGDMNPDNPCEVCDPSTDPRAWTPVPDCDAGSPGGTDAGPAPTDGGAVETDAGPGDTDAGGMAGTDAGGMAGTDAGGRADAGGSSGGTDAGPGGGDDDGGCSVSATGSSGGFGLLLALGAIVALPLRRRR